MASVRRTAQAFGREGVAPSRPRADQYRVRLLAADLMLEFRATSRQARNFADAIRRWPSELQVLVDGAVRPDLPVLPYCRLWD